MRERVFGPLGMRNTFADRSAAEAAGLVQGHTYIFGWPVARTEPEHTRLMVPAGYVVSTANDLGRYLAALLPATDGDTTWRPIPPELRAELFRPWRGGETGVGLSWGITRWNGLRAYTHEGMTPGFYSVLVLLPDAGYGIAVLVARNAGPFFAAPVDLADGIIRRLTGQQLVTYGNRERLVRRGFLALLVLTIVQAGRHLRRWRRLGRPVTLRPAPRVLALLGLDLALSVGVVVWILRGVATIPLVGAARVLPGPGRAPRRRRRDRRPGRRHPGVQQVEGGGAHAAPRIRAGRNPGRAAGVRRRCAGRRRRRRSIVNVTPLATSP